MYDPQIGDTWTRNGRELHIIQSDPLNSRVQIEYTESRRTRWIDVADLLAKYTFVA